MQRDIPGNLDMRRFVLCLLAAAALGGCGNGQTSAGSSPPVAADPPASVAGIYVRACKNCHAVAGTGAPQTGDRAAWAPRLAQGDAVLLDHTFNGFKGMPPMGACMDCGESQYRALIEYMAGSPLPKK
ncbi:cytochrome c5 family protein [Dyella solisilvae]|uniref:Cytochrome c5 family protein n=1 Tax=Dyella solisilvae TaxID=1920168 RepID=A0A370K2C9_9GAMM|nr:cytochrome c5 family protein [Dyella solisilvae]